MTASANGPASSGWTIVSQVQTQQLNAANQFVQGVNVSFVTGHGSPATIFVPYPQYNPQTVAQMVSDRAAMLDAIQTLSAPDQRY